jgi:hypothetical protein
MDIWEANSISTALTPHPCESASQTMCEGDKCGGTYSDSRYAGTCDPDGCDFNPYRMGNESFYGPDKIVDTNSKMTVVTQFITSDNTDCQLGLGRQRRLWQLDYFGLLHCSEEGLRRRRYLCPARWYVWHERGPGTGHGSRHESVG